MHALLLRAFFLFLLSSLTSYSHAADTDSSPYFPDLTDKKGWMDGSWRVRTSIHTHHYTPQPEHNNHQKLLKLEYLRPDDWFAGIVAYHNSFGQPSQYIYLGHEWTIWANQDWRLHTSLSAGILHGYKDQYKHKIPFNRYGIAPGLLPTIGLHYR